MPAPQMNGGQPLNAQCTAPQLRRFIKSRPYVPMHELRRRFGIDGGDDDVTPVRLEPGWVYVGLPRREGGLLGELLKAARSATSCRSIRGRRSSSASTRCARSRATDRRRCATHRCRAGSLDSRANLHHAPRQDHAEP